MTSVFQPSPTQDQRWEKLHPLSPVVRSGRTAIVLVIVVLRTATLPGNSSATPIVVDVILVGVVLIAGLVRWLVTRWRFDGDTLQFETGLVRRDVRRVPVTRIQAVDVVQPFMARVLGVAEIRIHMGGSGKDTRLLYIAEERARALRAGLLAAHHGLDPTLTPEPQEVAAMTVPTRRIVASVLLSAPAMIVVALVVVNALVAAFSAKAADGVAAALAVYLLSFGLALWRRFNALYGFTLSYAPDGVHIRRGLLGTVAETVPFRRVQAVRQTEPLLWRLFGWCRLEVDLAGSPGRDGNSGPNRVRKALIPVGGLAQAQAVRDVLLGPSGLEPTPPPRRSLIKTPLSYHFLRAGYDDAVAVAVTGRIRKTSCWVPLDKLQSIRRVQGPVQRRLRVATVHLDVAGNRAEAVFRDRDAGDAEDIVARVAALSRVARSRWREDPQPSGP